MRVGAMRVGFMIFDAGSLKEKRRVMRSVKDRLANTFNVSVAEVGSNEKWQYGEIGIATVANDPRFVDEVLAKVEDFLESLHSIRVVETEREIL